MKTARLAKGNQVANTSLRDYETIPLKMDIQEYFAQEVLPHVPDAWIDESKTKKDMRFPLHGSFINMFLCVKVM